MYNGELVKTVGTYQYYVYMHCIDIFEQLLLRYSKIQFDFWLDILNDC